MRILLMAILFNFFALTMSTNCLYAQIVEDAEEQQAMEMEDLRLTQSNESILLFDETQSETMPKKVNFIFEMDYSSSKHYFTEADAQKLKDFLVYSDQFLSCNSDNFSVVSKTTEQEEERLVEVVDELEDAGYEVRQLRYEEEKNKVVFTLCKGAPAEMEELVDNAVEEFMEESSTTTAEVEEQETWDCEVCDQIQYSKELLRKFDNVDYGGELIFDEWNPVEETLEEGNKEDVVEQLQEED